MLPVTSRNATRDLSDLTGKWAASILASKHLQVFQFNLKILVKYYSIQLIKGTLPHFPLSFLVEICISTVDEGSMSYSLLLLTSWKSFYGSLIQKKKKIPQKK